MEENRNEIELDKWLRVFDFLDKDQNKLFNLTEVINSTVQIKSKTPICLSLELLNWDEMGSIICHCKCLKRLSLSGFPGGFDQETLSSLFPPNTRYIFSLERVELGWNEIGSSGVAAICPLLRSQSQLQHLDLGGNEIDDEGIEYIANVLDKVRVKKLLLPWNQFSATGLSRIFSSANSSHIHKLNIEGNDLRREEVTEMANFLKRKDNSLENLIVGNNETDYMDRVEIFLQSIQNNTALKMLRIEADLCSPGGLTTSIQDRLCQAMQSLVCNTSSLESVCQSNHKFEFLCLKSSPANDDCSLPWSVDCATTINRTPDISLNEKLRCKLKTIYFQREFDLQPFLSMKVTWMPNVLELLAKEVKYGCWAQSGNLNGLYRIVRQWCMPDLFIAPRTQNRVEKSRVKYQVRHRVKKYRI